MSSERQKHRQAALKAWETIRRKHKEQRVNGVEKLTQWIDAEKIGKIPHPEILEEPVKEPWCARARARKMGLWMSLGLQLLLSQGNNERTNET